MSDGFNPALDERKRKFKYHITIPCVYDNGARGDKLIEIRLWLDLNVGDREVDWDWRWRDLNWTMLCVFMNDENKALMFKLMHSD